MMLDRIGGRIDAAAKELPTNEEAFYMTLRSRQHVRMLHILSEGEIEGVVDAHGGIYFDDVPLRDADGAYNFSRVSVEELRGTNDQPAIAMSGMEAEQPIGVELKSGLPIDRAITDIDVDAVRLTVSVPHFYVQNMENGAMLGTIADFSIDYRVGDGPWTPMTTRLQWHPWFFSGQSTPSNAAGVRGAYVVIRLPDASAAHGEYVYPKVTAYVDVSTDGGPWVQIAEKTFEAAGRGLVPAPLSLITFYASLPIGRHMTRCRTSVVADVAPIKFAEYLLLYNDIRIAGKTMSKTQMNYYLRLPPSEGEPRYIRVKRITPDSHEARLQNKTFLESMTLIWDEKLRYPNSAAVALSFDAEQFQNIPRIAFNIRGIKVLVPSNYDPYGRTYDGSWDGTFKRAWTNNPAWIWYDMLTNTRYGLGGLLDASLIDKWALYGIAQYCDELVPDGYGGMEPRFTCNISIDERKDAWRLVNDLISVFRAIAFWAGGTLSAVQDSPRNSRYLFTNANVVGGQFSYQSIEHSKRYNVASVAWSDPSQQYKRVIELVERPELIAKWGEVRQSDVIAVGCTSRGQARRLGRWLLYAESEACTFSAGADGALPLPGDIIDVLDANRAGARNGGRLLSGSTASLLLLDAPLGMGGAGTVGVILADGSYATVPATAETGSTQIALSPALPSAPLATAPWAFSSPALDAQKFRVVSVGEGDDGTYVISAVAHDPDKFAEIEYGTPDVDPPTSLINIAPPAIEKMDFAESLYDTGSNLAAARLSVSWTPPVGAARYLVDAKRPDGEWARMDDTRTPYVDIDNAASGLWSVRVTPVSILGREGMPYESSYTVVGLSEVPSPLTGLRLDVVNGVATLAWDAVPELDVKLSGAILVRHARNTSVGWEFAMPLTEVAGRSTSAVVSLLPGKYLARPVDSSGNVGDVMEVWSDAQVPLAENIALTVAEAPAFSGAKSDGVSTSGGYLKLGGVTSPMSYRFSAPTDLGHVYDCHLVASINASLYDDGQPIDSWADFDSRTLIDGDPPNGAAAQLWVRTSDVSPADWSAWKPVTVGDFRARMFEFELRASVEAASHWIDISELSVIVDMPDRIKSGNDVPVPASGLSVTFDPPYHLPPAVSLTAQGLATGDWVDLQSKTVGGFTVHIRNASGTAIAGRTVDYIAKGY